MLVLGLMINKSSCFNIKRPLGSSSDSDIVLLLLLPRTMLLVNLVDVKREATEFQTARHSTHLFLRLHRLCLLPAVVAGHRCSINDGQLLLVLLLILN